jgi:hypothetical protein
MDECGQVQMRAATLEAGLHGRKGLQCFAKIGSSFWKGATGVRNTTQGTLCQARGKLKPGVAGQGQTLTRQAVG